MIYLNSNTINISIPKHIEASQDVRNISLMNSFSKDDSFIILVTDVSQNEFYYNLKVNIPDNLIDGEYTYKLVDVSNNTLETGLAIYGEYKSDTSTYEKTNINKIYERI